MRYLVSRVGLSAIVGLAILFAANPVGAAGGKLEALSLINQAVAQGEISAELGTLYKVYSIRTPEKIPSAYRPTTGFIGRCATPVVLEALQNLDSYSPEIQAEINQALARPSRDYTFDSPGGHFKIHYNLTGTHAVPGTDSDLDGTPDYIEKLGDYADSSWNHEVTTLGWRTPPSDEGLGGDNRYDIYTESMGYYGYTDYDGSGPEEWADFISYISVHKNFIGFPPNDDPDGDIAGAAKVTVAHEFNHACQLACDGFDEMYFYELSATYMEDVVFDVVNDCYNYLSTFFDDAYISLRQESFHAYSTFIFGLLLHERLGPTVMPEIWEYIRYSNATVSIDLGLADYGTSFAEQFSVFTGWNYLTGFRADGLHYEEAAFYPIVVSDFSENSYPTTRSQSAYNRPQGWGSNYITFNHGGQTDKILGIEFNGQNLIPWSLALIPYRLGQPSEILYADIDPETGDGTIYVPFFPNYMNIVGIPGNMEPTTSGGNYEYTATLYSPGDVTGEGDINPLDVVVLVNYVYRFGEGLVPADCFGDCNCDGAINPIDVVILVNHVYRTGDAPCP